jgi:hypothetical protein
MISPEEAFPWRLDLLLRLSLSMSKFAANTGSALLRKSDYAPDAVMQSKS